MYPVPFDAAAADRFSSLAAWRAEVPSLLERTISAWNLELGEPLTGGVSGSVFRVTGPDGAPAVLKLGFPHREGVWEAVGLASFPHGMGPRVLAQDSENWSLLLEVIEPGGTLGEAVASARVPELAALAAAGDVHARMRTARVGGGIPTLLEAWAPDLAVVDDRVRTVSNALDHFGVTRLVADAIGDLACLLRADSSTTLLHGDFNPGNVLGDMTGSWKLIDPKPMVGDGAFDLWPLVSQIGDPFDSASHLARNVGVIASAAGVDPIAVRAWGFALAGINLAWQPDEAGARALRAWAALAR